MVVLHFIKGLILVILISGPLCAAFDISVTIDRTEAYVGDNLALILTVSGPSVNLPSPEIPVIDHFRVSRLGQHRSMSVSKEVVSATEVHRFLLVPLSPGNFRIPPFGIRTDAGVVYSSATNITVIGSETDDDMTKPLLFIEQEVDRKEVFQGEQLTYVFRFFSARRISGRPSIKNTFFDNFRVSDPRRRDYTEQIGGRTYSVMEFRYTVYPIRPGENKLGIGGIGARVDEPGASNFLGLVFSRERSVTVESSPLNIKVKPLPSDAPAGFSGLVGEYSISSSLLVANISGERMLSYIISVRGDGYTGGLELPEMDTAGYRIFDMSITDTSEEIDSRLINERNFEVFLIPVSAQRDMPVATLVYFDPAHKSYRSISTEKIRHTLEVTVDDSSKVSEGVIGSLALSRDRVMSAPIESSLFFKIFNVSLGLFWGILLIMNIVEVRKKRIGEAILRRRSRALKLIKRGRKCASNKEAEGLYACIDELSRLLKIESQECSDIIHRARINVYSPEKNAAADDLKEEMRRIESIVKSIIKVCLLIAVGFGVARGEVFDKAVESYKEGNWQESLSGFTYILNKEGESFGLLYNLGNVSWNAGDYGAARYYWERSLSIKPFSIETHRNISVLRNSVSEGAPEPFWYILKSVFQAPSVRNILFLFTFISGWALLIFLQLWIFRRKKYLLRFLIFSGIIFAAFLSSMLYLEVFVPDTGVLIRSAELYSEASTDSEILSKIYPGVKAAVIEEEEGFIRIEFMGETESKTGWIKRERIRNL